MFTDKKAFEEELKAMLKAKGRESLLDTAEEFAEILLEALRIFVKHSENKIDDVVFATLESLLVKTIDGINKKED